MLITNNMMKLHVSNILVTIISHIFQPFIFFGNDRMVCQMKYFNGVVFIFWPFFKAFDAET